LLQPSERQKIAKEEMQQSITTREQPKNTKEKNWLVFT
jgi:hypothetical protein